MLWSVLIAVGGAVFVATTFLLRDRLARPIRLTAMVVGAIAVGLGVIGVQDGASAIEWVLAPLVLAALALLHDRLLFAGTGPRRI